MTAGRSYVTGGRTPTGRDVLDWVREGVGRGAGEILLTSMDRDGTKDGYDLDLPAAVTARGQRPGHRHGRRGHARPSGGGTAQAGADAVLVASIFHYGDHTVAEAKAVLAAAGVPVRPAVERSEPRWDLHRRD